MRFQLFILACLFSLVPMSSLAVDNIIVPNNDGHAYMKDTSGNLFPVSVVYTTDGNGNVAPILSNIQNITIGTVGQGAAGSTPWLVNDSEFQTDFDAWKIFADTPLSTLATQSGLTTLTNKFNLNLNGALKVDGSAVTQPISGTIAVSNLPATQPVSGTITANLGTTAGLALDSTLSAFKNLFSFVSGALKVDGSAVTQPVSIATSIPLPVNAAQEAGGHLESIDSKIVTTANGIKVDVGSAASTVSVSNFPSVQQVSGSVAISAWPSTQQVAGTVTANIGSTNGLALDSTLSTLSAKFLTDLAGNVKVNGSGVTQPVTGTVSVGNFPTTQPVSGTVTSNIGTTGGLALDSTSQSINTKITTTANGIKVDGSSVTQPISGSISVSNLPSTQPVSGTVTANVGTTNGLALDSTLSALNTKVTTTANGIAVDGSGVTQPISGSVSVSNLPATQSVSGTVTSNIGTTGGLALDSSVSSLSAKLTNNISGDLKVDGSSYTQPVSGSVSISNLPSTQTVAGTVTANIGTTNGLALDTTSQSINTKITTTANGIKVDGSNVVQPISGNVSVTNFPSTQSITGSVNVGNFPSVQQVSGTINSVQSGNWLVRLMDGIGNSLTSQLSGSQRALDVGVNVGGTQIDPRSIRALTSSDQVSIANFPSTQNVSVTNFPATQPVSGTVTANIGTTNGLALDSSISSLNSKFTTTANGLKVDGSSVTQPISGTVSVSNLPTTQTVTGSVNASQAGNWFQRLQDGLGNAITSQVNGSAQRALDVGVNVAGVQVDPRQIRALTSSDSITVANFPATVQVAGSVSVSNFPATQAVSGTVTSNIGTTNGLALDSTSSAINTKITTSVNGIKVDGSSVTQPISGSVSVSNFPSTQTVAGTVAATQSGIWSTRSLDGSGNVLTSQVSGSQRAADVGINVAGVQVDPRSIRALTSSDQITVANFPATQTVAGTVTANIGTTNGLALDTTSSAINTKITTTANGIKVDGSAVTQPTSVTNFPSIQAVSQSGTWNDVVTGNVASGATDSGNPVKVGGVFNTANPSLTSGQRVDVQTNQFGAVSVNTRNKFLNKTTTGATVVKSGPGVLHMVCFNNQNVATAIVATLYDNTAASGTTIAAFSSATNAFAVTGPVCMGPFGAEFTTGLTINLSAAANVSVFYQ